MGRSLFPFAVSRCPVGLCQCAAFLTRLHHHLHLHVTPSALSLASDWSPRSPATACEVDLHAEWRCAGSNATNSTPQSPPANQTLILPPPGVLHAYCRSAESLSGSVVVCFCESSDSPCWFVLLSCLYLIVQCIQSIHLQSIVTPSGMFVYWVGIFAKIHHRKKKAFALFVYFGMSL